MDFQRKSDRNPKFRPQLYGIRNFYVSAPLKGTKYIKAVDEDVMTEEDSKTVELGFDDKPHSLRECAEEFLVPEIWQLYRNNSEAFNKIRDCYLAAYTDGVYEAANNLTVLDDYSYGQENSTDTVIELLTETVQHGSKYAMINLFTVLWCDEKYDDAIEVLKEVAKEKECSLMCLYNLAALHYLGDEMPENTLKKSKKLTKKYLRRIVETAEVEMLEDEERKVIGAANKFLAVLDETYKESDKSVQPKVFVAMDAVEYMPIDDVVSSSHIKSAVYTEEEYKPLVEKYAEAWKELDETIIFPYLASNFTYSSMWVKNLDLEGFKEHLASKFRTLKFIRAIPTVEVAKNSEGRWAVKLINRSGNVGFIDIEIENGKIKSVYSKTKNKIWD